MKKYKLHKILLGGSKSDVCSNFPDLPSIINTDRQNISRIIAIGDIHGDLDLAINFLLVAKVIERHYSDDDDNSKKIYSIVKLNYKDEDKPRYYKWIGEKTIVVQVGDQVDRCRPLHHECIHPDETINDEASDIKIMFFYHDLHLAALNNGCAVYSLLGNHELMNVLGNMTYVSYKGLKEFDNNNTSNILESRIKAFELESTRLMYKNKINLANFLACSRLSAIIVDKYLFVHAGILDKLIKNTLKHSSENKDPLSSIEVINKTIQSWLLNDIQDKDKDYIVKLLGGKALSPFWPRTFGNLPSNLPMNSKSCNQHVKPVLELLKLKAIIVGHTPQLKKDINSTCDNTVWRVDIAGSQAFDKVVFMNINNDHDHDLITKGRIPQVLEIILGNDTIPDKFNVLK